MTAHHSLYVRASALVLGTLVCSAACAQAAPPDGEGPWRFGGTLYLYLPSVSLKTGVPVDSGGTKIDFDVLEHLKFTAMGSLEAHNGRWGAFTDFIYLNFDGGKHSSRDFSIGSSLPVGTTADFDWDLKGLAWTVGGQYRLVSSPGITLDALGGARLLDVKTSTKWSITGDIGPFPPTGRAGSDKTKSSNLDAIVGVRGRVPFGPQSPWSVPFYADVGTGESKLTWQAAGGIRYAYQWGDVTALWRVLAYELKSSQDLEKLKFSGPMLAATWRW